MPPSRSKATVRQAGEASVLSEEYFRLLPPPVRSRLRRLLTDFADEILHERAYVLHDRRGDGRAFWRLYLESGSGLHRKRRRVYVGPGGGRELSKAVQALRKAFWGDFGGPRGFLAAMAQDEVQDARANAKAAKAARALLLSQTHRHAHGRTVRASRSVSREARYRAEYRHLARTALEKATWKGITEEQYVGLRVGRNGRGA